MAPFGASRGRVLWRGRPVRDRRASDLATARVAFGFLFQGAALFDSMPVYDNVAFGLRQNTDLSESRGFAESSTDRLKELACRRPSATQTGRPLGGNEETRRTGPRAGDGAGGHVYDEPTTGLDPVMSDVINQLILRTRDRGHVTSIVVTHDMRTVERVADRVVDAGSGVGGAGRRNRKSFSRERPRPSWPPAIPRRSIRVRQGR